MIEEVQLFGRLIYILRDDKLGLKACSGNKYRKLKGIDLDYIKKHCNSHIISYGGSQSNAMAALSQFCLENNLEFSYVIKHEIPELKKPGSNLKIALLNGMQVHINKDNEKHARNLAQDKYFLIKEGVEEDFAKEGFREQAEVLNKLYNKLHNKGSNKDFSIFLTSGTGLSASALASFCPFRIFTIPVYGSKEALAKKLASYQNITVLKAGEKVFFAKPNALLLEVWREVLDSSKIEFDLIYDALGLLTLKRNLELFKNSDLVYIHQGGVLANPSQLARYEALGLLNYEIFDH